MPTPWLCLALALFTEPGEPGEPGAPVKVFKFHDAQGVEHYVDHREQVPPGAAPVEVDLTPIPLNPEVARALSAQAIKKPAAASAPEEAKPRPPPPEATLYERGAAALSLAFLLVSLVAALARRSARAGGSGFGVQLWSPPLRFSLGALALMGWAATAYLMRDSLPWLKEAFAPLKALDQARATTDRVQKQQKQMERQIDQALRGQ